MKNKKPVPAHELRLTSAYHKMNKKGRTALGRLVERLVEADEVLKKEIKPKSTNHKI